MRALLLVTVWLFAGCSTHRFFTPREHQDGSGPAGHPAALYPLDGPPPTGELRLWSGGAELIDLDDGNAVTELHVGFELENHGEVPLVVDTGAIQCTDLVIEGQGAGSLAPHRLSGNAEVAPGAVARLDVWFRPPAEDGLAIDGFAVRFRIAAGDRTVLAQSTPFVPYRPTRRWHDDWYWYGGYWGGGPGWWGPGPGWGWGWGPGWGWGWGGRFRC